MGKHQLLWFRNLTLKWHLTKTVVFQIKDHLSQNVPKTDILSCWEPSKRSHCHWLELQIGGWESGVLLALYLSNFSCKKIGFAIFGLLGALKARIPSLIGSSNFGWGDGVWEWSAPQVLWLASPHHNLQKNWWWWIGPWDVLDNGSLSHLIS
jgi:hypothetical protein